MPPALLLLPVALLAAAAPLVGLLGRRSGAAARVLAALAAWAALLAVVGLGIPTRGPLDIDLGELGAGLRLAVRLDAVSLVFSLFSLVPAALLLTFLPLRAPGRALLALAFSVLTLGAGGLVLAALAIALAVGAVALMLQDVEGGVQAGSRIRAEAAVLSLVWAATALYATAGTDQFAFTPIATLRAPVFALVAAAALLLGGVVPWRPWTVRLFERFPAPSAAYAAAILLPIGFNLLLRMYQAGDGHFPSPWFNFGLGGLGALVTLAAALRAQAAPSLRPHLAEALPGAAGFALLALALGTPLGVAAALGILAAAALLATLPALLPPGPRGLALILVLVAGLPPTLVFASRVVVVEAAVGANEVFAYTALVACLAWLLGFAAAARALRLPVAGGGAGSVPGALAVALLLAAGGVLLGVFQTAVGNPAAAAVIPGPSPGEAVIGGGLLGIDTAAGSWPGVALGLPVLLVLLGVALAGRRSLIQSLGHPAGVPGPVVEPAWRSWPDLVGALTDSFEIPDQFRVTGWESLDRAMARASIWFWLASFGVLAVLLLR